MQSCSVPECLVENDLLTNFTWHYLINVQRSQLEALREASSLWPAVLTSSILARILAQAIQHQSLSLKVGSRQQKEVTRMSSLKQGFQSWGKISIVARQLWQVIVEFIAESSKQCCGKERFRDVEYGSACHLVHDSRSTIGTDHGSNVSFILELKCCYTSCLTCIIPFHQIAWEEYSTDLHSEVPNMKSQIFTDLHPMYFLFYTSKSKW